MLTAGYKYSWRKMEAAEQNRAEDGEELVCGLFHKLGETRLRVKRSLKHYHIT